MTNQRWAVFMLQSSFYGSPLQSQVTLQVPPYSATRRKTGPPMQDIRQKAHASR